MNWTSVRVSLEGTPEEQITTKLALNTLAYEMRPNKCKSACWGTIKTGDMDWFSKYYYLSSNSSGPAYYEILIPDIKPRQTLILKDLGYKVSEPFQMPKKTRRDYYNRILKTK